MHYISQSEEDAMNTAKWKSTLSKQLIHWKREGDNSTYYILLFNQIILFIIIGILIL